MQVYYLSIKQRPLTTALSEQSAKKKYIQKPDLYLCWTPLAHFNADLIIHNLSGVCVSICVCVTGLVGSAKNLIVWYLTARREHTG